MPDRTDIEAAASRDEMSTYGEAETEALLPISRPVQDSFGPAKDSTTSNLIRSCSQKTFGAFHITAAFVLGVIACVVTQYALCGTDCFKSSTSSAQNHPLQDIKVTALAPPYAGSTEVHHFPPTKPTNGFPSMFPSQVGYAGGTPTGAEPAVIATAPAYPFHHGRCSQQLVPPITFSDHKSDNDDQGDQGDANKSNRRPKFELFKSWGNLSPWYSVGKNAFGIDSTPDAPDTCVITGLHFLHRHGARYPTATGESNISVDFSYINMAQLASVGHPSSAQSYTNRQRSGMLPEVWIFSIHG
jgi:hypothetical protein